MGSDLRIPICRLFVQGSVGQQPPNDLGSVFHRRGDDRDFSVQTAGSTQFTNEEQHLLPNLNAIATGQSAFADPLVIYERTVATPQILDPVVAISKLDQGVMT
jgi:hypothetical protein